MTAPLSPNTQAILLLTAPLIVGRVKSAADLLTPGQYKRLAQALREKGHQPSDLLGPDAEALWTAMASVCAPQIDRDRLRALLGRGFQLSQAVERWHSRALWVLSRADTDYPRRLKARLKEDAPAVLYGCGDARLLDAGGLAVVGSRQVDETLIEYTEGIGRLAARAGRTLVSGAARGIDQAAMRGALEAGGRAVGVMADSLDRAALNREHRNLLLDERLVLVSPFDPNAGFNVGNAMQRNKVIYALADAALVVSSDHKKGGTWAGAIEQLQKYRQVPVYVRATGEIGPGLIALQQAGALPWPEPETAEDLARLLDAAPGVPCPQADQPQTQATIAPAEPKPQPPATTPVPEPVAAGTGDGSASAEGGQTPADELFATVRSLIGRMPIPKTEAEIAAELNVSKTQAKEWLLRLVQEGIVEQTSRPVRYRPATRRQAQGRLFG